MAKSGGKRTYVRDGRGRFASTPGSAAKKAAKSTSGRTSTLGARTGLKGSRAKLKAKDKADQTLQTNLSTRAQKGAVKRGSRKLAAAKVAAKTRISGGRKGVIGKPKGLKPGALAAKGVSSTKSRRFAAPGAASDDVFSRSKRTKFPTTRITPDVTDRPPIKQSAAMLTRERARSVYGNQLVKGTTADGSFSLASKEIKAPFGRFSTVKNPAPAKSFPSQAPLRSKKGELVARKGRIAAAAARKTLKAKPLKPTPSPPTRTKGSKASLPRTRGTVAKPKGLKPGVESGTIAIRRSSKFPRSLKGKNVDKNVAFMYFMDRAQSLPDKRKKRNDYNLKRMAASVRTSERAQDYINKYLRPRSRVGLAYRSSSLW